MGRVARRFVRGQTLLLLAAALLGNGTQAAGASSASAESPPRPERAGPQTSETQARMREIFAALGLLLPLTVDEAAFAEPKRRDEILQALGALADPAAQLADHARPGELRRRVLGRSLARDAEEARRAFRAGRLETSGFLIHQLVENCIACHTALPSPGDAPLAEGFLKRSRLVLLAPLERARLQMATRRFDEALASYEEVFTEPELHPAELLGPLTDYLTLCIRVKQDFDRPIPVLQRFERRADLWQHLRMDVRQWIDDLRTLRAPLEAPPAVGAARTLLHQARQRIGFPSDRAALVPYIVASSILQRFIAERSAGALPADEELAEAYYLLGLTESRIGRNDWVALAGVYFETAIRMAPRRPFAERAYAILEEETLLDHPGQGPEELPAEVAARLAELRAVLDASAEAAAPAP